MHKPIRFNSKKSSLGNICLFICCCWKQLPVIAGNKTETKQWSLKPKQGALKCSAVGTTEMGDYWAFMSTLVIWAIVTKESIDKLFVQTIALQISQTICKIVLKWNTLLYFTLPLKFVHV